MNEQLIVKNFGPITDATVDFKRVTVFIGPTGGGKSTLAKLAAVFKNIDFQLGTSADRKKFFSNFRINSFFTGSSTLKWSDNKGAISTNRNLSFKAPRSRTYDFLKQVFTKTDISGKALKSFLNAVESAAHAEGISIREKSVFVRFNSKDYSDKKVAAEVRDFMHSYSQTKEQLSPNYVPAERIFVSSIEYSWAGLMRDDIGLAEPLLDFSNAFSLARKFIKELSISFLDVKYIHVKGRDFIKVPELKKPLMLLETASGIQSVTPLLVLLEHLSGNTEQAQSFIIEEPELNLYPTAQQGLLNWLVEKCTQGENDLTITTHSPYLLAHLNLLLYAYQVAEKHPERREAVAAIVPEASWINPKEFACYQVENGGVQSLVDADLGLIDNNELDGLSGDAADAFDNLIRLSKGFAIK